MNRGGQARDKDGRSLLLGVLLSLLLHGGVAWALEWLPQGSPVSQGSRSPRSERHVQVVRRAPLAKQKPHPAEKPKTEKPDAPFAKTTPDAPKRRPTQADFIGSRNAVASGEPDAPQRSSDAPLPTMAGRESEEEIVTFDQERQDGELAHEGRDGASPAPAEAPSPPAAHQPLAQGAPDGHPEQGALAGEVATPSQPPPAQATTSQTPAPDAAGEGLKLVEHLAEEALTLQPQLPPPAPLGQPEGNESPPTTSDQPRRASVIYDPSLADKAQQPGLRTYERRTRSTGSFVFGRRPSLNVAATARGRYEADVYRRIARMWYAACDEHRGDIIPGSITVSLRLSKNGRIDSMDLIRRRGASLSQQSFSFAAIRHAALPPMPAEVQQSIVGRLYEMILTFNFD